MKQTKRDQVQFIYDKVTKDKNEVFNPYKAITSYCTEADSGKVIPGKFAHIVCMCTGINVNTVNRYRQKIEKNGSK